MNATEFNKQRTGNVFVNGHGLKHHFRVLGHENPNPKFVVFYVPGYTEHINRPEFFATADIMTKNETIFIGFEARGHGYSEGARCFLRDHEDMVDDVLQFIDAMLQPSSTGTITYCTELGEFQENCLPVVRKLPFFLWGPSMGGAVSTMVGQKLQNSPDRYPLFRGVVMFAPALRFKTANWLLILFLRYTAGTCTPSLQMPTCLSNVTDYSLTFKHDASLQMLEADTWGKEGALGWGKNVRWGTALMFIDFAKALEPFMSTVSYPFLILHDPGDEICDITGSRMLMEKSATAGDKKKLVEVPGHLHGLLCNDPALMCELSLEWMREMASNENTNTAVVPGSTTEGVSVDGIGASDTERGYAAVPGGGRGGGKGRRGEGEPGVGGMYVRIVDTYTSRFFW